MDALTELAMAARDGDRAALVEFIGRTQPDIRRMAAHLVDREQADDVAQETYIRAIRALPRFRGDAAARTWLLTICRATCADAVRRAVRQRRLDSRLRIQRPPGATADQAGLVDLQSVVQSLDIDRRTAFVLTQVLGLRYDQAAEVCGVAVGTIRSRVARARAELIRLLRDEPDDLDADGCDAGVAADDLDAGVAADGTGHG